MSKGQAKKSPQVSSKAETISNFGSGISKIYDKKWDFVNNFSIQILQAGIPISAPGISAISEDDLNIALVNVNLPQFTCAPVEFFSAGKWKIANGRDEILTCSMTFRDYNYMSLYKLFTYHYTKSKQNFFDDCKMEIIFSKNRDTYSSKSDVDVFKIQSYTECLLTSISQIDFNNTTESQIMEFTVEFRIISPLKEF